MEQGPSFRVRNREATEAAVRRLDELLRASDREQEARAIAAAIPRDEKIAAVLSDPAQYTIKEARCLVRFLARHNPNLDVEMLRLVAPSEMGSFTQDQFTYRVLELVTDITEGTRAMPLLLRMLRHAEGRALSKLVLLVGRLRKDAALLADYFRNQDDRIRANAVEALWGNSDRDSVTLFGAASRDHHHRVALNGLIGLFLAGQTSALQDILALAAHDSPLWRAAAAWALGRLGDEPAATPVLRSLLADPDPRVRGAALRAIVALRKTAPAQPSTKSTS